MKLLNFSCFSKLLINLKYRLQTGMRGAFRKPQGTVARVNIGQPIMSIRSSDKYKAAVIESLRRAKFKFPGRQKGILFVKGVVRM
jgi:ribosomal protein L16/L10AE